MSSRSFPKTKTNVNLREMRDRSHQSFHVDLAFFSQHEGAQTGEERRCRVLMCASPVAHIELLAR